MGGLGKTQVALEYCQKTRKEYDFILWADADNENTMKQGFEEFARRLSRLSGVTSSAASGLLQVGNLDSDTLSSLDMVKDALSDSHFLLVIDNLENPNAFQNVKDYIPLSEHGHTIITSRHGDTVQLGTRLEVDLMTDDEAFQLLTVQSKRIGETRENGIKIIEILGWLPLAIDQAACYIRFTHYSYQRFIEEFNKRRNILQDSDLPIFWDYRKQYVSRKDDKEIQKKLGVWTMWQLSLDLLKGRNNGILKTHLLTLSAFLNGRNISQATLIPWFKFIHNSVFVDDSAKEMYEPLFEDDGLIEDNFPQFVADANNLSIVQTLTHDERGTCYSIHPLIIEWLRRQLDENDRRDYISEALSAVETCLSEGSIADESIKLEHEVLGHVRTCFQNSSKLGESNDVLGGGKLKSNGVRMCLFLKDHGNETDENEMERILKYSLEAAPSQWDRQPVMGVR